MGILEAIESTGFAVWLRESPSIFAYTFFLSMHAIGLAVLCGMHSVISLRLLGAWNGIPLAPLKKIFPWIYLAMWIEILSGLSLLSAAAVSKLTQTTFYIKLAFIAAAITVLVRMHRRVFNDQVAGSGVVTDEARLLAKLAIVFWFFAIVVGRLTEYPDLTADIGL